MSSCVRAFVMYSMGVVVVIVMFGERGSLSPKREFVGYLAGYLGR